MDTNGVCGKCGAKLTGVGAGLLCPGCLLEDGLSPEPADEPAANQSAVADHQSEITEAFPRAFGDYELLEEIARGGMGIVYKARQVSLDRLVAAKMLLFGPLAKPEFVQRFRTEATAAGSLHHPNIVSIHEVGIHQGQHYLVMDFVNGPSLARLVADQPLPAPRAAGYVKTIAEAIQYAHDHGVLHRDLKPSNVLLDENDQPKVTDFGLAKRLEKDTELTLSGQVLGSPNYMPPEQAAAHRGLVGKRSDVYSLGAILYHLLTGRAPFVAPTIGETLQQVQTADPVSPTILNPHLPRDLKTICLKCLEKEPARRYQTAQELADELGRFLDNKPLLARPVSRPEKLWRWCRRKPVIAALSAATVLLLLTVAIGSPIALFRINKHRHAAEQNAEDLRLSLYAADISLAQEAVRINNRGRALELLNRHRPERGQRDLRGWEWRYLWGQCQGDASFPLCRLSESDSVRSLAFRPGADWVALGGYLTSGVEVWELSTRRRLAHLASGESFAYVVFSPDGRRLAFSTWGRGRRTAWLRVWDCATQVIVAEAPLEEEGKRGPTVLDATDMPLAFSADGETLVSFQPAKAVTRWRVSTLEKLSSRPVPKPSAGSFDVADSLVADFAVTPDLRTTVLPGFIVMDLESGTERWRTNYGRSCMAISPEGARLATTRERAIEIWDLATGTRLAQLKGHQQHVDALKFSSDGRSLISSSADQTLRVWNLERSESIHTLRGHRHEVLSLDLSTDGTMLVSGGKDGEVLVWDLRRGAESRSSRTLPGRHWAWHFSTDGRAIHTIEQPPNSPRRSRRWPMQGRPLADYPGLEYAPGRVVRYQGPAFERRELLSEITLGGDFVFSSSGRLLATATTNGVLRVWDLNERTLAHEVPVQTGDFRPVVFSSDERQVWLLQGEGEKRDRSVLTEWNLRTKQRLRFLPGVRDRVLALPPGDWVFWRSDDGALVFHDFKTGLASNPAIATERLAELYDATASANGDFLALCHHLGTLSIWKTASLGGGAHPESIKTLRGVGPAFGVCTFSANDKLLLGGGAGTEAIKIWETHAFHELLTLEAEGGWFHNIEFSPDGRLLGAINSGGTVYLRQAPTWEEIEAREKAAQSVPGEGE